MGWFYEIKKGRVFQNGTYKGNGYSGHGAYKNDPAATHVKGLGPLPEGDYKIGTPFDSSATGKFAMMLYARPNTETYGRGSFEIHGDSVAHPGEASHGCIILPRALRELIAASGDDALCVVGELPEAFLTLLDRNKGIQ